MLYEVTVVSGGVTTTLWVNQVARDALVGTQSRLERSWLLGAWKGVGSLVIGWFATASAPAHGPARAPTAKLHDLLTMAAIDGDGRAHDPFRCRLCGAVIGTEPWSRECPRIRGEA